MTLTFKKNKKGNIADVVYLPVFLLLLVFTIVVSYVIYGAIHTEFNAADSQIPSEVLEEFNANYNTFPVVFSSFFLIAFVGFMISTIVSAFFIRSHPIFYFISVIVFAVMTVISAIFSNVYELFVTDMVSGFSTSFPIISHVMTYLPYFVLVFSAIVAIALYTKGGGDDYF